MKHWSLLLILALLFAAACGTNPPTSEQWCYRYKFAYDDFDFSVGYGEWIAGIGFAADDMGRLDISYVNPVTVQADQVVLKIVRVSTEAVADVTVNASADIYGQESGTLTNTLPMILNAITTSYTDISGGSNAGAIVHIGAQQDHPDLPLALQYLEVRGHDVNPFNQPSNCDDSTPTPSPTIAPTITPTSSNTPPPTLTPSISPTPSNTSTATATPTPTNTPEPFCEAPFDAGGGALGLTIDFDCPDPLPYTLHAGLVVPFEGRSGSNGARTDGTDDLWITVDIPDDWYVHNISAYVKRNTAASSWVVYYRLHTSGGWGDLIDIGTYGTTYTGVFAVINDTGIDAVQMQVQSNLHGAVDGDLMWLDEFTIVFDGDYASPTPTPTNTPAGPTATPTHTPTVNPAWTRTFTPRPLGTPLTPTPSLTVTRTPRGISVPPTSTYILGTLPPPATAWATVTAAASYTPNATGTEGFNLTSTAYVEGTGTAAVGGTGTPGATGTPIVLPWETVFPGDGGGGDGGGGGIGDSDLIADGRGLLAFGENAMTIALQWLGQMRLFATGIISIWQNVAPQPIAGLPHCATERFASELCAIYYILTYTVFSGTIGQLIIPAAIIDLDIFIIFLFIRYTRAILARLAAVLKP